ncbi:hypothetical protein FRX31_026663 [Thalictrum thalictroides]|uniref:Uncharacterized protein n=1 Tax=Thalictrum thalictroides TaxID=46969 RepID=A0A7J6VHT6_THATH|nr:hypothetical protein FRX31_026663 [Thalictrum thalictroides]
MLDTTPAEHNFLVANPNGRLNLMVLYRIYLLIVKSFFAPGISLSMEQWNILRKHMDEIDEAVAENS